MDIITDIEKCLAGLKERITTDNYSLTNLSQTEKLEIYKVLAEARIALLDLTNDKRPTSN